jgi:hypothetical protein
MPALQHSRLAQAQAVLVAVASWAFVAFLGWLIVNPSRSVLVLGLSSCALLWVAALLLSIPL